MMNDPIIIAEEMTCRYGDLTVLDHVSFEVDRGSICAIVGRNGAGKTTTLQSLLGLQRLHHGYAQILGMDSCESGYKMREKIGYLPESRSNYGYMRVQELLDFVSRLHRTWNYDLIEDFTDTFDYSPEQKVENLSSGMRTQLGFTLALAHNPEILILDEPTAGLDAVRIRQILQTIVDEVVSREKTVLMCSHALYQIERIADHVIFLKDGKVTASGAVDDFHHSEKRIRVVFQVDPPDDLLNCREVVNVHKDGRQYLITVSNLTQEFIEEIKSIPHFTFEILDMNLEEIFLEHTSYRGDEPHDV